MKAVVMAGGEGSRLRPLTIGRPKPMVPIVDAPVMEHIFALLRRHEITEVVVTLQYLARVIQEYFDDGSDFGMRIHYTVEDTPLEHGGEREERRVAAGRAVPGHQRGRPDRLQPGRDHRLHRRRRDGHPDPLPRPWPWSTGW